jgi:hypothetical protein
MARKAAEVMVAPSRLITIENIEISSRAQDLSSCLVGSLGVEPIR